MKRNLRSLLAFAPIAALVTFGFGVGLGPDMAWAQTATKLKCKGCVKSKTIKKGAVKFDRLQGKVQDRITDLESAAAERVPFYITLDSDGAEQTIATNGALRVFARCIVDEVGQDRVEIVFTSDLDGWFAEELPTGESGPFAALDEAIVLRNFGATGVARYDDDSNEGSAAAPDGSFISVTGEATALGLNIFSHNCLAIGNVFLIKGSP